MKWDDDRFEAWYLKKKAMVDARLRGDFCVVDESDSEGDFMRDFLAADEGEGEGDGEVEGDDGDDRGMEVVIEAGTDVEEEVVNKAEAEDAYESVKEDDGGLLCSFLCDFVCDLPSPSNQLWDRELTEKVSEAWRKCHRVELYFKENFTDNTRVQFETVEKYAEDLLPLTDDANTVHIDLRGQCAEDAKKALTRHLHRLSRQPQSALFVIVGRMVHGIGEGKLKQSVISLLTAYETFKWTEECGGAIISIKLGDCCGWTPSFIAQEYLADETDVEAEVEAKEKSEKHKAEVDEGGSLCTIISDFLCDIPTYQRRDPKLTEKVLAGLKGCYGGLFEVLEDEENMAIDLRGLYSDDAEYMLMDHLDKSSSRPTLKFLNITVGCLVYGRGNGKRNLWRVVVDILMRDKTIKWVESKSGAVISIELDGRKDYRKLRNMRLGL